jgi:inorganic triphosphatase YgiF
MKEIELKLLVDAPTADRVSRSPAVLRFARGEPVTRRLRTVYHDTPKGALGSAGIALRTRHDGTAWTQTVKAARTMQGGFSEAVESPLPLPGPEPDIAGIADADLRARVGEALGGAVPGPVFETAFDRTTWVLDIPHLGQVELALDRGEIRAGERAEPFAEVELELLGGSPRAIFEAARHLLPEGGARFSALNKADRGALLRGTGRIEPEPAPRNARLVALAPAMTAEQGARAILSECLDQVAANIRTLLESDDPEGPHQLRVGLRRLRSACLLFRPVLGAGVLRPVEDEAKWLGREVGRLRDLDVALAEILGPEFALEDEEPGVRPLAEALERAAADTRAALRETLRGKRVWSFLLDLGELVMARGWLDPSDWDQTARLAAPLSGVAAEALDRRLARVDKRADGIAKLSTDARHELRKELKKLRYAVEFLAPLYPAKKVKPFLKRLKALQTIFGELNDAAMVGELFRDPDGPASRDVAAARAAGFVIGVHTERARRAWEDAKAAWKDFRALGPFWR